ncbi:MAG TPA: hypothetical protein VK136_06765 [Bacillota bacterium]|nr:hypothetical protein [Bacillota bacterium]
MWDRLLDTLSDKMILFCTVLSFLLPYMVYKVNTWLHDYGDPPWKKEDRKKE